MTLANTPSATLSLVDDRSIEPIHAEPIRSVASAPAEPAAFTATQALTDYERLSGTERFDFIQSIYNRLGKSITDQAVGAQWSSIAHRLSCKVDQVNRADRTGVIKDILTNQNTRFSRAYSDLDTNTRLAFWHRIVRGLNPYGRQHSFPSAAVQDLVTQTENLSADQQLKFLTQAVDRMGV